MDKKIRVSLDMNDFRNLIAGDILKKDGAEICLQDIGYPMMQEALDSQIRRYTKLRATSAPNVCEIKPCANDRCKAVVLRRKDTNYPEYCLGCYKELDKKS